MDLEKNKKTFQIKSWLADFLAKTENVFVSIILNFNLKNPD
jgi:hypothetical protein